ncbi:hypothetical protein VSAL_p840_26 (plasmid) [Aliivibrio salmonicida LFI1238]|uniref:Uncharacterized protein n=1 Tax=Aliivibrio salmonicida (strain LFI1238) TaxID=316275 RepID=B6ESZ7_ALISL|nr:hypothetical protein [Aliivibrio salmonicida]CAQ81885.1 hypothetical protein VSAL_p840_26 [Aliivibrio salmonicida LFI1238]
MNADIYIIYDILVSWDNPKTYSDLTNDYKNKSGEWHSPQSWAAPLGLLNQVLADAGAPALSALVVSQTTNEPGLHFWSSASNVPEKHNNPLKRHLIWQGILKQVFVYPWPSQLPAYNV